MTIKNYKDYTITDWIMFFIEQYGQCDGGHHKQWTLDQIVRIIKGTPIISKYNQEEEIISTGEPSKEYLIWVDKMMGNQDENGDYEFWYDTGIAP